LRANGARDEARALLDIAEAGSVSGIDVANVLVELGDYGPPSFASNREYASARCFRSR
jgi:hypothetical protein